MALEDAVEAFRTYYANLPSRIKAKELLRKRPLALYAAMGITTPGELAESLVKDRLAASREMALGYLYERVLEDVCDAEKLNNLQKKNWRGIDFRKQALRELSLINLKASRGTSNSDMSQQTLTNLEAAARQAIREEAGSDDNPLQRASRRVRAIRGIARGRAHSARRLIDDDVTIELLVGDALWDALGAGSDFTARLQRVVSERPVDMGALAASTVQAIARVEKAVRETECVNGFDRIDWPCLFTAYPDA